MRPEELKDLISQRPFVPLRLHITGGETVDITHPDAAIVTKSMVYIGQGVGKSGVAERAARYSLIHVVKVEEIDRGHGNGKPGRRRSA